MFPSKLNMCGQQTEYVLYQHTECVLPTHRSCAASIQRICIFNTQNACRQHPNGALSTRRMCFHNSECSHCQCKVYVCCQHRLLYTTLTFPHRWVPVPESSNSTKCKVITFVLTFFIQVPKDLWMSWKVPERSQSLVELRIC